MDYRFHIAAVDWAHILAKYALWTLMTYLTGVWNLSITHAAGIVNIFGGSMIILKIGFAYIVDTFGDYPVLVFSSIAYSMGLGILTMSTPPVLSEYTGTCSEYKPECIGPIQKVLFYTALALISTAISGLSVSYPSFSDKQNGDDEAEKGIQHLFRLLLVPIFGAFVVPYVKPRFLLFGIPAICSVVATIIFLSGSGSYKREKPKGSPLTNIFRVIVASTLKSFQNLPSDPEELYDDGLRLRHTDGLRFLDKAAIKLMPNQEENRWRLCTVSQVEETKIAIHMVPILMTFIMCGLVVSFGSTYFLDQENYLSLTYRNVTLPLPMLLLMQEVVEFLVSGFFHAQSEMIPGHCIVGAANIGLSMLWSTLCCIIAAIVEARRLTDKTQEIIPINMYWVLSLYILLGLCSAYFTLGVRAFTHGQISTSMASYIEYFCEGAYGLGYMASNLLVYVLGKIEPNWFQHTSNMSRLDNFYWTVAALSAVNLVLFILHPFCYWRNRRW